MIGEISFKCQFFLTVMSRDVFRNPIKSLWWNVFAKIVNDFQQLTIFAKKLHRRYSTGF